MGCRSGFRIPGSNSSTSLTARLKIFQEIYMEAAFRSMSVRFFALFCILALCAGSLMAQGGSGQLTGQVTDSTGAVVAGVEVKLTNSATGEVRTTVTSAAGLYAFP